MEPNYLFMLLGYPGSGKTHFSQLLASEIGAVRINADAMRVAAFGTIEVARGFNKTTGLLNSIVFGSLDYVAAQVLQSGHSVVCDYQHNEKSVRDKKRALAKGYGAIPIVIWVKTPQDVAVRRGSERDETLDHRRHSSEKMEALVEKFSKSMEVPGEDEGVIVIDGTLPFQDQHRSFVQQLGTLNDVSPLVYNDI